MNNSNLDSKLEQDCFTLGKLHSSYLLLMNNKLVPWFIIVPNTTATEIYELPGSEQDELIRSINVVSAFIKESFNSTKLNVASIGNVVHQLHIHVVGRNQNDFCWPGVVWGRSENKKYNKSEVAAISRSLQQQLHSVFKQKID